MLQVAGLTPSPSSLEQLHCHEALTTYAHETQEEENLFGALIADVVLPKLQELAVAWDPFDATATIAVIKLVDECSYGIDKNGRKFEVGMPFSLKEMTCI